MPKMTIKEVAKLAKVSPATVSRVLNDNASVDPELREKVLRVIREQGYRPSLAARNLKAGKTHTVGLVVADLSDRYYSNFIKAVGERLRESNYSLFICNTDDDPDKEREYLDLLVEQQVDGIILNTTGGNDDHICRLSRACPLGLINRRVSGDGLICDFIDSGNQESAEMMAEHLIRHGHTRIGIVNGSLKVSTARERLRGFANAMRRIGIEVDESYPYRYEDRYSIDTGMQGAQKLLHVSPPPTALMTMNNFITVGVLRYCKANGIAIPKPLSLVAYGEVENSELFAVQPDYITYDATVSGNKAACCLLERIDMPSKTCREIIYSSGLVSRGSVQQQISSNRFPKK